MAEHARVSWSAAPAPGRGQELALHPRHVHADRTLRFARPALEAQIEHLMQRVVGQPGVAELAGHRQPQCVGTPACRVRLLARRHEGRAHGALVHFPARTESAAHLDGTGKAAVVGVVEERVHRYRAVRGSESQVRCKSRGVHDLARIKEAIRIERALDLSKRVVEHRPEHSLHERAPDETIPMLAGQRAAVAEHEVGHLRGDRLELRDPRLGFQVDHRSHMQAPDGRVGIDTGRRPMPGDDRKKVADIVAKLLRRDGRVFHEGDRLRVAFHRHREAERRFANLPDRLLRRRVGGAAIATVESARDEVLLERIEPRRQIVDAIAVQLDAEQRGRLPVDERLPEPMQIGALPGVIEDECVHHLDCRRVVPEDRRRRRERVEQIRELDHEDRFC